MEKIEIKEKGNVKVREIMWGEISQEKRDEIIFEEFCNEIKADHWAFSREEKEKFKQAMYLLDVAMYFAEIKKCKIKGMKIAEKALEIYPKIQLYSIGSKLYSMVKLHTKFNKWHPSKDVKKPKRRIKPLDVEFGKNDTFFVLLKRVKNPRLSFFF